MSITTYFTFIYCVYKEKMVLYQINKFKINHSDFTTYKC